jgi:hypothetical protein
MKSANFPCQPYQTNISLHQITNDKIFLHLFYYNISYFFY